jgi:hypothetical protein
MVKATRKDRKRRGKKRRITNSRRRSERRSESPPEGGTDSAVDFDEWDRLYAALFGIDTASPVEYRKLKELLSKHQTRIITDEEIKADIGKIIYTAKSLHKDKTYRDNLVQCIDSSTAVANLIGQLYSNMRGLDPDYLEACLDMALDTFSPYERKMFRLFHTTNNNDRLVIMMYFTQYVLKGIGLGLSCLTQRPEKKRGRGQPPVPYVLETWKLILLWHSWTGKSALTPKKLAKLSYGEDQGHQPSTEFVRLCLKMIDPEITPAEVRTCITNAKKIENKEDLFPDLPDSEYRRNLILTLGLNDDSAPALERFHL